MKDSNNVTHELLAACVGDIINLISTICTAKFGDHDNKKLNFAKNIIINLLIHFTNQMTNHEKPGALLNNISELKKEIDGALNNLLLMKGTH